MLKKLIFLTLLSAAALESSAQTEIPSSRRSREAINRVEARVKTEFGKLGLRFGSPIFIRIFKESMELEVWVRADSDFELFRTYNICTWGAGTLGPKVREGDGQAPEGFYFVTPGRLNPYSSYHLSFNLGYPNEYDRVHERTGGALMVHGECVSIGCYAMTNAGIDEIYAIADAAFRGGQKFFRVHIFPFRMTDEKLNAHKGSSWFNFWSNLRDGYEYFEESLVPPNVEVKNRKYVFETSESRHAPSN